MCRFIGEIGIFLSLGNGSLICYNDYIGRYWLIMDNIENGYLEFIFVYYGLFCVKYIMGNGKCIVLNVNKRVNYRMGYENVRLSLINTRLGIVFFKLFGEIDLLFVFVYLGLFYVIYTMGNGKCKLVLVVNKFDSVINRLGYGNARLSYKNARLGNDKGLFVLLFIFLKFFGKIDPLWKMLENNVNHQQKMRLLFFALLYGCRRRR